jgi:hypothetical protein
MGKGWIGLLKISPYLKSWPPNFKKLLANSSNVD